MNKINEGWGGLGIKRTVLLASVAFVAMRGFDNKAGWKLDADGKVEMKDGNPVWINGAGEEQTVQGDTITRLNGEAKSHREAKEAAETKLKAFDGIDPAAARKAIETIGKIDAKALIDAGEVDKVKETIKNEFTAQLTEKDKALNDVRGELDSLKIGNVFAQSDFVRDSLAVPRDMFEATFKSNFKLEDGKIVAYDRSGNRLMSKEHVGEYAKPDEALKLLVDMHPQKDTILKADSKPGSGNGGGGGGRGAGRTIKRADFENLNAQQQAEAAGAMQKGELAIVD